MIVAWLLKRVKQPNGDALVACGLGEDEFERIN
jgi:hypothetical protein